MTPLRCDLGRRRVTCPGSRPSIDWSAMRARLTLGLVLAGLAGGLVACGGNPTGSPQVGAATSVAAAPAASAGTTAALPTTGSGSPSSSATPSSAASATSAAPVTPGRVFLVGDSVMAALNPDYTDAARKVLGPAGWAVTIDAKVNRSTIEGRKVLKALHPGPADTVVIMLGHNDAGTPSVFAPRVDGILQDLQGVKRVFWLTMREPRYSQADAVLTAAQAKYPNLHIIPWASSIQPGWTAKDGLHLNAPGARGMAQLILQSISLTFAGFGSHPGSDLRTDDSRMPECRRLTLLRPRRDHRPRWSMSVWEASVARRARHPGPTRRIRRGTYGELSVNMDELRLGPGGALAATRPDAEIARSCRVRARGRAGTGRFRSTAKTRARPISAVHTQVGTTGIEGTAAPPRPTRPSRPPRPRPAGTGSS